MWKGAQRGRNIISAGTLAQALRACTESATSKSVSEETCRFETKIGNPLPYKVSPDSRPVLSPIDGVLTPIRSSIDMNKLQTGVSKS